MNSRKLFALLLCALAVALTMPLHSRVLPDGPSVPPPYAVLVADGPSVPPPYAVLVADGPSVPPPYAVLVADGPSVPPPPIPFPHTGLVVA